MSKRTATKRVVGFLVQYGTGAISHSIVKNNVSFPTNRLDLKIAVTVASYVLGGVAAKAGVDYSDKVIDEVFDLFEKVQNITK